MSFPFSQVILTRESEKSEPLRQLLTQHQIPALIWPLIQIRFLSILAFRKVLNSPQEFDWLVFPSSNAVHGFFKGLQEISVPYNLWTPLKIAVVGKATAKTLSEYEVSPPLLPQTQRGEDLAQLLTQQNVKRILLLAGKQSLLSEVLKTRHLPFDFVPCYETEAVPVQERASLDLSGSLIVFASPSAVDSFLRSHSFLGIKAVVAIGKTTAKQIEKYFSGTLLIAENPSDEALLQAILSVTH